MDEQKQYIINSIDKMNNEGIEFMYKFINDILNRFKVQKNEEEP